MSQVIADTIRQRKYILVVSFEFSSFVKPNKDSKQYFKEKTFSSFAYSIWSPYFSYFDNLKVVYRHFVKKLKRMLRNEVSPW